MDENAKDKVSIYDMGKEKIVNEYRPIEKGGLKDIANHGGKTGIDKGDDLIYALG